MLFTSYIFFEFLIVLVLLYYLVPVKWQWKLLLAASYLFYFYANPIYCIYIFITTVTTWYAGCRIQSIREKQKNFLQEQKDLLNKEEKKRYKAVMKHKTWLWTLACLIFNIGVLAVVKYTNFCISNANLFLDAVGSTKQLNFLNIIVPLGISFYTFQAMGYIIDVYRKSVTAEKNIFKFALFVSFFPQLIQGPISRFKDLSQTLFSEHRFNIHTISLGLQRILWGYFKKLVIADRILIGLKTLTQNPEIYSGAYVFVEILFYAFQLYADFTGGIDITIGVAQMLGIHVTENFKRPFFSKNIKEYWKRWHITMSLWFKDYIFYPITVCRPMLKLSKSSRKYLGETIGQRVPIYLSSFAVWFATGIWHGASWNFIVWGLGNWIVIMISQELEPLYAKFHNKFHIKEKSGYRLFEVLRTVFLVSSLNLLDIYPNVALTFGMFGSMFTASNWHILFDGALLQIGLSITDYIILVFGLIVLLCVSLLQRKGSVREQIAKLPYWGKFVLWYGLFLIVLLTGIYGIGYDASQFIYNQF